MKNSQTNYREEDEESSSEQFKNSTTSNRSGMTRREMLFTLGGIAGSAAVTATGVKMFSGEDAKKAENPATDTPVVSGNESNTTNDTQIEDLFGHDRKKKKPVEGTVHKTKEEKEEAALQAMKEEDDQIANTEKDDEISFGNSFLSEAVRQPVASIATQKAVKAATLLGSNYIGYLASKSKLDGLAEDPDSDRAALAAEIQKSIATMKAWQETVNTAEIPVAGGIAVAHSMLRIYQIVNSDIHANDKASATFGNLTGLAALVPIFVKRYMSRKKQGAELSTHGLGSEANPFDLTTKTAGKASNPLNWRQAQIALDSFTAKLGRLERELAKEMESI